jgi:hypothetical protein
MDLGIDVFKDDFRDFVNDHDEIIAYFSVLYHLSDDLEDELMSAEQCLLFIQNEIDSFTKQNDIENETNISAYRTLMIEISQKNNSLQLNQEHICQEAKQ